jgi:hypothetical protein
MQVRHAQGVHNVEGETDHSAYMKPDFFDARVTPLGWNQVSSFLLLSPALLFLLFIHKLLCCGSITSFYFPVFSSHSKKKFTHHIECLDTCMEY